MKDQSSMIKFSIRLLVPLLLWVSLSGSICVQAQTFQKTERGAKGTVNAMDIEVQWYTPSIVRVLKSPQGKPFVKESLSVTKSPEKVIASQKQVGAITIFASNKLQLRIDGTGAISFHTLKGNVLLAEKSNGSSFTPFNDAGEATYSVRQSFTLGKDESIYGLGQLQGGKMVMRNQQVRMIQSNTQDYVPFVHSVKGYGLFWDNYSPTTFTDNQEETSFFSEVGDGIDYYFMLGGNADGVIAQMRTLTGQAPMFPLWTYGYFQSKERYKSQIELVGIVKRYRELGVPLDGIIQDWQYWGSNYLWNAMEFLNGEFPKPVDMVKEIHDLHAHVTISIWNSFGPETKQYKELEKINALFDFKTWPESGSDLWPPRNDFPSGVRVYDPYNPSARDIYWKYLNQGLFSLGIDGWWMDSTEPDHMQFKPSDLDNKTHLGSFRKVRNAFPLMSVGGVYDHQRATTSDKRVFILTRSAFAGQQRYGANTWSGDIVSTWTVLRNQIPAGLNFSLTGIPYWNSDIGGFFLWRYPRKLEDPDYRELYVRWLQFGTFCPLMRSHGADAPREIFQFGKKGEPYYDAIEKFIHLRYALIPYIYATSWDVTKNHSSMMRALMMDFPSDKTALNINDQYMFGKSLLVSPVTEPMYTRRAVVGKDTLNIEDFVTVRSKETYLPQGTSWFDFWTGEKLSGGTKVTRPTPLDIMPLYVRAGSVLPIGPRVQYTEEKPWDNLEVRVYPGANGKFELYEDENDNYNYEKGIYSTVSFVWDDVKRTLTIGERAGSFPGMLQSRTFNIVVVGPGKGVGMDSVAQPDKVIVYDGKKVLIKL
jgi:alpha-D-xyloside xylohydrolase